jgi:hypothetical protein
MKFPQAGAGVSLWMRRSRNNRLLKRKMKTMDKIPVSAIPIEDILTTLYHAISRSFVRWPLNKACFCTLFWTKLTESGDGPGFKLLDAEKR